MKAAPEGVVMPNQSDNEAALRQCCSELQMPADMVEWILSVVVRDLREVKDFKIKTVPRRKDELEGLAQLARQLNSLVQGLDIDDRARIEKEFDASSLRLTLDPPKPLEAVFKGVLQVNILRIGDVLLTLAAVADVQHEALHDGSKGGRPSVLPHYAWIVAEVARMVHPLGIEPGRGGNFEVLCEAIFAAAGVSAMPENAIRMYMKDFHPFMSDEWLQGYGVETPDEKEQ